jgi:hypothetical protein
MNLTLLESLSIERIHESCVRCASKETAHKPNIWLQNRHVSVLTGHCFACAIVLKILKNATILTGEINGERHAVAKVEYFRKGKTYQPTDLCDLTCAQFGAG